MPTFTYTNGAPNPPNSPSVDVVAMQQNTNSIPGLIAIDHVGFNSQNGGTHNQSTYNAGGDASTSVTQGSVYTKTVGSDIELFYRHKSNGSVVQLTGLPFSSATNGYITLPGGILIQWGTQLSAPSGTAITFPISFSSTPYSIQVTVTNNSTNHRAYSSVNTFSATQFKPILLSTNGNPETDDIFWIAIGPA